MNKKENKYYIYSIIFLIGISIYTYYFLHDKSNSEKENTEDIKIWTQVFFIVLLLLFLFTMFKYYTKL